MNVIECVKSQNRERFWDFGYDTTYDTSREKWGDRIMNLKLKPFNQLKCPKNVTYDTLLGYFFVVSKRGVFETLNFLIRTVQKLHKVILHIGIYAIIKQFAEDVRKLLFLHRNDLI